jgi:dTDP-4-amino-4,6-dideoxygalactose transaminase
MMKVPFADLYAQYISIKESIDKAIEKTITSSSYIGGKDIASFEEAFAAYLQMKHVIGCGNGTDSIEIILKALGIGSGDEVIVPANSWISTSEAVSNTGATPVFVDIEPLYFTIDVHLIEAAITANTKAIIPVHLYGHPADMNAINAIAKKNNLKVIEDCAQAHGATIDGKMIGSFGDAASFSFYPGKNLGAYGDAGCMATDDTALAEKLRMIANHGQLKKHQHVMEGRNSRLDGLQAGILLAKLPHLNEWTNKRIEAAAKFSQQIINKGIILPVVKENYKHVYHLYVIRTKNRDAVQLMLKEKGIETAIHYPVALPFLQCYSNRGYTADDFPVAALFQNEILSLPMYAELSDEAIAYVAGVLNN